jgi:NAD(P)-dependent dehydrogenase (short-subunit alcohol dehydrogenase family)
MLGRSMALAFAAAGMNVVVADVREEAAQRVADEVAAKGVGALAVATDVADLASVTALADRAYGEFGAVNLLCNNAGRNLFKPLWELSAGEWQDTLSSHLGGVVNGVLAFLPRLMEQGGERHIVNTSSMSGVGLGSLRPTHVPYVAAKFAIAGMSEAMAPALAPHGIGVSVLCPGWVSADAVPEVLAPSAAFYKDDVLDPAHVGPIVLRGVQEGRLHIFTHPTGVAEVEQRHELLLRGFAQASADG